MWRTMRWSRGFFRLWFVLSVLWLGLIGWGAWEKLGGRPPPPDDCREVETADACANLLLATNSKISPFDAFDEVGKPPRLYSAERRVWSRFFCKKR